jgi:hypothetical protein
MEKKETSMRSNKAYGKFLAVISTLFVFICGSSVTSVANVPKGETGRHDVSVKGHNANSHPVGDLTIAQRQQLTGDEVGLPTSKGKRTVDRTVNSKRPGVKPLLKNKKASNKVNSNYIGETEKNLDKLSITGEDRGNTQFFDEADALFGKRSNGKVKGNRDR